MKSKIELIANIVLIAIGIGGGIHFFVSEMKDLSAILFSIALASILYQFLGGIGDSNKFKLGAIKFGGSAAVLIGFMFYLKGVAFVPTPEEYKLNISGENWIPISVETGKTVPVTITNGQETREFPDSILAEKRQSLDYKVEEMNAGQYVILTSSSSETEKERIGNFKLNNLKASGLFNNIKINDDEKRVQVFKLYPDKQDQNSSLDLEELDLPFEISVYKRSRFEISLLAEDNSVKETILKNAEIVKKTAYIVPISDKQSYVVFLEQAVSEIDSTHPTRYSKWLVKKIDQSLTNVKQDEG